MRPWERKWFGFWATGAGEDRHLPALEDWVDAAWDPPDRSALVSYLERAPVAVASGTLQTPCRLCPVLVGASDYQCDGTWLWPVDLAHYVLRHGVRLPEELIAHVRGRRHEPPRTIDLEVGQLPWPSDARS